MTWAWFDRLGGRRSNGEIKDTQGTIRILILLFHHRPMPMTQHRCKPMLNRDLATYHISIHHVLLNEKSVPLMKAKIQQLKQGLTSNQLYFSKGRSFPSPPWLGMTVKM
jgi:hypothetical protein